MRNGSICTGSSTAASSPRVSRRMPASWSRPMPPRAAPPGPPLLYVAAAGRQAGRVAGGRPRLPRDRAPGAQKNDVQPHLKEQWCIPPKADAEFVCHMEDVLEVYHRPYHPRRPLVCLDEAIPPGQARRIAERLEWHHTPKHGSWLNRAECALSAWGRQGLDQRIGTQ